MDQIYKHMGSHDFRAYRPVLLHPQPLASTDEVSAQSVHIVDPRFLGSCTVVSIMLNIKTNQGLRYTVNNGQCKTSGGRCHPKVLQTKE
jgi:hypothetical protein